MATERVTTSIIDPATGKAAIYDRNVLTSEISAPTTTGVRSILSGHPSQGLDPARLAAILRQAENGNARAQWELAEEIEEKYLHYQGVLGTRKRAVSQLDITVEAATDDKEDQRNADFLREWLERDTCEEELFDILDGVGKGVSFTEVVWSVSAKTWIPEKLKTRFGQWFDYDLIDGETPRLVGGPEGNASLPTDLPPFKFIVHNHPAKTGLPLRGGLIRGVAWAYLFQAMSMRDWVIFAEVYGMPIRIGKYGPSSTDEERRILLRAVSSLGTDAAAIIPASMIIDFQNAQSAGNAEVYERLITKIDDSVSKAVVGQTGTTDSKAQGLGSGSAGVHNEVRGDIKRADAKKLRSTLNAQLFRPMIDLNFGPPASGRYPKVNIGQAEKFTKEDLEILTGLVNIGVPVEASVARDRAGYPDPPETGQDGKPVRLCTPSRLASAPPETPLKTPPEKAPQAGKVAPGAAVVAASGTIGLSEPVKSRESGVAPPANPSGDDALDALTAAMADELVSDWQPIMAPLMDPLRETIAAATSYADLQARLLALPNAQKAAAFAELLARGTFIARLAGEAGLDVTEQQK